MSQTHFFIFVRKDLPIEQQIVQAAHAAYEVGKQDRSENIRSLVLSRVNSEDELLHQAEYLNYLGIKFVTFREPDIGNQATAIATAPLTEQQRKKLRRCKLWEV